MKKLKIVCTILLSISIIALPFVGYDDYWWLFFALKGLRQFNGNVPHEYINYLLEPAFPCFCALIVFATLIFLLIVLWKSDLQSLTKSISEKTKSEKKAKLQREIAEKTAQLEELNNQPSGEGNGE